MSSGLGPSGVPAGSANSTLGRSAGNDTSSQSSFASAPELTTVSTFTNTNNSTVIEILPTPSPAATQPSEYAFPYVRSPTGLLEIHSASTTISATSALVRTTLVKATSGSSSPATPAPATSAAPSTTSVMASSSSKSASASESTTAKAAASPASSASSKAPRSAPAPTASSSSALAAPSSQASPALSASPSSRAVVSTSSSPEHLSSSSTSQHAGAEAPASSSPAIGTTASSAAGTGSSSSTGQMSGLLSAAPSPASSSPAPSSGSIVSLTENSDKPLSSGSPTITSGPSSSQGKSASAPNVIDVPGTTSISTLTELAQTTFSTPVSIAVTASDGRTAFSAPPLVTSVSPSTRTDGMVVQVTHVIANPNSSLNALNKHSFFDNAGAVAGTFIAVGIVATALAAFLLCFIRRRRRRTRRARLESRLPQFPFHDDPATPQTAERRSISVVPMNMDDPSAELARTRPSLIFRKAGSADGRFFEYGRRDNAYEGPFADYRPSEHGHGAFGDHDGPEAVRAPSRAVTTPSIYPSSLPDDGNDRDSMYEQEVHTSPPLRAHPASSVQDYIPLERRNPVHPSTGESNQLRDLDAQHPPLLARPPLMLHTSSFGYASSSTDHGSSTDGHQTPGSESAIAVGLFHIGDDKERVGVVHGLHRPASPQSVFLRRQLSKSLAEAFSIPAELRRMSIVNDSQEHAPVAL